MGLSAGRRRISANRLLAVAFLLGLLAVSIYRLLKTRSVTLDVETWKDDVGVFDAKVPAGLAYTDLRKAIDIRGDDTSEAASARYKSAVEKGRLLYTHVQCADVQSHYQWTDLERYGWAADRRKQPRGIPSDIRTPLLSDPGQVVGGLGCPTIEAHDPIEPKDVEWDHLHESTVEGKHYNVGFQSRSVDLRQTDIEYSPPTPGTKASTTQSTECSLLVMREALVMLSNQRRGSMSGRAATLCRWACCRTSCSSNTSTFARLLRLLSTSKTFGTCSGPRLSTRRREKSSSRF